MQNLCYSNPNIFLKYRKSWIPKHICPDGFGKKIVALYEEDGKQDHCVFFQLPGFRCLASWLGPWPGRYGSSSIPLLYCWPSSPHSCPFYQNLLAGKALGADRSQLKPRGVRLDPVQLPSNWLLTKGRLETECYLLPLKAGISLLALCPASDVLG